MGLALGIVVSGKRLKKNTKKLEEPAVIHPIWKKSLSTASSLSSSARSVTKSFSNTAINTFSYIIDKTVGKGLKSGNSTVKSTTRASLKIIDSLSDAGAHVLSATTDTATELVEHRYGSDAAVAATHGGTIAKNSYKATTDMRKVASKSFIKAVGKVAAQRNSKEKWNEENKDDN